MKHGRCRSLRKGMTLLETLTVIAIVALLIAGTLPQLRLVRNKAEQIASLSNLRQHVQVFEAYAADYSGFYPWFTDPNATWTILRSGNFRLRVAYFDAAFTWNIALASGYYDGNFVSPMFASPTSIRTRGQPLLADYQYSPTFITDWRFWNAETRTTGRSQWRAVRTTEVSSPSKKGLLVSNYSVFPLYNEPVDPEIGFVDGSAHAVPQGALTPPYPNGLGRHDGIRIIGGGFRFPVMHTPDGVHGRDIQ